MWLRFSVCVVALALMAVPALADALLGVWLTKPDKKGQVAHVVAAPCGQGVCGTIARTFDKAGKAITTPNIGKRIFWDMKPVSPGAYEGRAWLPLHRVEFDGKMAVNGDKLTVRGCIAMVCQSQVWTRLR
ncbi:Uncharacterized conserved protein, DUF2147 family [Thalassovita taeanensis]|uniref:Uncharacterized conserved protein, DUF2147 family n=2 Tax=Thalassovita taeanensis TaxID=657014 RepID=A0A1H9J4U4_9RHOB|nr:Uncharacterized conserved protein, DUF2147 family [Thalassovita taeanensis]